MAVTMTEIARRLGVSTATVSRVLSGRENGASEEVRGAILGAAATMGYRPRRKTGRTVAFLIDHELFNLSSLFYTAILSGVEKEAALRRSVCQFIAVKPGDMAAGRMNLKLNDLAGVVLIDTYDAAFVLRLRTLGVPVVLVDFWVPTEDLDAILVDNVEGIVCAGKHLSALGHTRVAYISGTVDSAAAQERRLGFTRARAAFGFAEDPALVEECPESISGGFEAMTRILERQGAIAPTAVIAYNDMVAIGAMDAIKQRGLAIPRDISIVGFDDISLAAEVAPPLTTMQVPKELMGRLAAETLFHSAGTSRPHPRKVLLLARLVERASTAAPAAR